MSDKNNRKTFDDLLEIMTALRRPETGCPWDLEQTFETIIPHTIEEAYEVADAIETGNMSALKDELGDLLFQIVFYSQLARESGIFDFHDVADGICQKMLRRHPHVFGSAEERAAGVKDGDWERLKDLENSQRQSAISGQGNGSNVLAGIPISLPSLTRAVKLQNRAARVGFDWPDLKLVFAKLREEMSELDAEISKGEDKTRIAEEFGDVMFVLANVARHLGIDPEQAVRATNAKFERRFGRIEELLARDGKTASQSDLTEMDRLWERAKVEERSEQEAS